MSRTSRTHDDLAGVVDLFGALTHEELESALDELAYKQGSETDAEALSEAVETAISEYYLVEYVADADDRSVETNGPERRALENETFVTVGPAAFPSLPPNAEDLPHILDVPRREVDREALGEQVRERLDSEVDAAIDDGDEDRLNRLYDVTYDLDAWAPVETEAIRQRLDAVLQD
ncbi:hypothetical protein AUR64_08675 [Haloprofundus marisrubri]|uniref:Uncharacterized protein n=1 Tax=Haloprofundus marisrubri TaxID=1514971 RepID=A0A0W1R869_9EURY|nr:hypothetical protein [Haloprofundus marisrubri]KTG09705.1 hypothetical protein AUR64_08675 [Haloprofundus marisrubri]